MTQEFLNVEEYLDKMYFMVCEKVHDMQQKLFDEVPHMSVSITQEEFSQMEADIRWHCKNWDDYWQVMREEDYKDKQDITKMGDKIQEYLQNLFKQFLSRFSQNMQEQENDINWLYYFSYFFHAFILMTQSQKKIFAYIDQYWFQKVKISSLEAFAHQVCFTEFIQPNLEFLKSKLSIIFKQEQESGENFEHGVILKVLTQCLYQCGLDKDITIVEKQANYRSWTGTFQSGENQFYQDIFETQLLQSIRDQYQPTANRLLSLTNLTEFVQQTYEVFDCQRKRADSYYVSSKLKMRGTVRDLFINNDHFMRLINDQNTGLNHIFSEVNKDVLKKLFTISYENSQIIKELCSFFQTYVHKNLEELVEAQSKPKASPIELVKNVIKVYNELYQMSKNLFSDDNEVVNLEIERTLNNSFLYYTSQKFSNFAQFLAKYCDNILTAKGNQLEPLEDIGKILGLVSDKDIFLQFYKKVKMLIQFLGHRLIDGKITSLESEHAYLLKFSKQEGDQYVKPCKDMIQDIENSQQLSQDFPSYFNGVLPYDFKISVVSKQWWNEDFTKPCKPKEDFQPLTQKFDSFYAQKYENRSLEWSFGQGEVYFMNNNILRVTQAQMMILLAMNQVNEQTFVDLMNVTGLRRNDMINGLSGLVTKGILVSPNTQIQELKDNDSISVNKKFDQENQKIDCVKNMVMKPRDPDVSKERESFIDLAVCQIMKQRKTVKYDDLCTLVRTSPILKFDAQLPQIKKKIEEGIAKNYYFRNAEDPKQLEYRA